MKKQIYSLYRHFDIDGNLLYVGCSISALSRLNSHRTSEWYDRISRIEIEHFKDKVTALRAEKEAIKKEEPIFNIFGKPGTSAYNKTVVFVECGLMS